MKEYQNKYQQRLSHIGLFDQSQNLKQPESREFSENILQNLRNGGPAGLLHIGSISWIIQRPIEVYDTKGNFVLGTKRFNACAPIQIQYEDFGETIGHWKPRNENGRKIQNQQYGNCLFEAISAQTSFDPNQLRLLTYLRMREIQKQLETNKSFIQKINQNNTKILMVGAGLQFQCYIQHKRQKFEQKNEKYYKNFKNLNQITSMLWSDIYFNGKGLNIPLQKTKQYKQKLFKQLKKIYGYYDLKNQTQQDLRKITQKQFQEVLLKKSQNPDDMSDFYQQTHKSNLTQIVQLFKTITNDSLSLTMDEIINNQIVDDIMSELKKIENDIKLEGRKVVLTAQKHGLLSQIINHNQLIKINITEDKATHFSDKEKILYFNRKEQNILKYKLENDQQTRQHIISIDVTLYHQLCHVYRALKGIQYKKDGSWDPIILFNNVIYNKVHSLELEELETVGCITKDDVKYSQNQYRIRRIKQIQEQIDNQKSKQPINQERVNSLQSEKQKYPLRKYYNPKLTLQLQAVISIIDQHHQIIKNKDDLLKLYQHLWSGKKPEIQKNTLELYEKNKQQFNQITSRIHNFNDKLKDQFIYQKPKELFKKNLQKIIGNNKQIHKLVFGTDKIDQAKDVIDLKSPHLEQFLLRALEYLQKNKMLD